MSLINGRNHDWDDIRLYLNARPILGIKEISYSDEREAELMYASGHTPQGVGFGNYKAEGDFTLTEEGARDFEALARASGKTPYEYAPMQIVVAYADKKVEGDFVTQEWLPTKVDTVRNVIITKREKAPKQADKELTTKYTFIAEKIT